MQHAIRTSWWAFISKYMAYMYSKHNFYSLIVNPIVCFLEILRE